MSFDPLGTNMSPNTQTLSCAYINAHTHIHVDACIYIHSLVYLFCCFYPKSVLHICLFSSLTPIEKPKHGHGLQISFSLIPCITSAALLLPI